MSDSESDDSVLLITAEKVKYLYIKNVLKNIINEANDGKLYYEVRLLDYEREYLENKNFGLEYMFNDYDYGERCKWYRVTWK